LLVPRRPARRVIAIGLLVIGSAGVFKVILVAPISAVLGTAVQAIYAVRAESAATGNAVHMVPAVTRNAVIMGHIAAGKPAALVRKTAARAAVALTTRNAVEAKNAA